MPAWLHAQNNESFAIGLAKLTASSPTPGLTLSGTVTWTVDAALASATQAEIDHWTAHYGCSDIATGCGFENFMFWLDGQLLDQFTGFSTSIDTTTLRNGTHELFVSVWKAGIGSIPRVGGLRSVIRTDNGHTAMALSAGYLEVRLAPAGTVTLAPAMLYTDGVDSALASGVTFASSATGVATVNASTGVIAGVANGVCTVTSTHTSSGKTATTRVVVNSFTGFPHFATNGDVLTTYDGSRSIFVTTLFNTSVSVVSGVSGLPAALLAAGVNALTDGFYPNPADNGSLTDLTAWQSSFNSSWSTRASYASSNGFRLYLIGDDICRFAKELNNSIAGSYSTAAIQYAMNAVKQSGRVIAIDMVDEVTYLWGDDPTPTDSRWVALSPSIPDSAFTSLMTVIAGSTTRPSLTWPIGGLGGPTESANWMGDTAISDFASLYWDYQDWRTAYYYGGPSPWEAQRWMGQLATYERLPVLQRNRPMIGFVSINGPYYTKNAAGSNYQDGLDTLQGGPVSARQVLVTIMLAAITGMAGVRAYGYDWAQWKSERTSAALGDRDRQTGADPVSVGVDRWSAMSIGFTFIHSIVSYLFQTRIHAVDLGAHMEVTARRGANGTLLMATNCSSSPHGALVNLAPYVNGSDITRYRVTTSGVSSATIASTSSETITLASGETVAYVIP